MMVTLPVTGRYGLNYRPRGDVCTGSVSVATPADSVYELASGGEPMS